MDALVLNSFQLILCMLFIFLLLNQLLFNQPFSVRRRSEYQLRLGR